MGEALTLASKVVRHGDPALFEKLFTIVKGKVKREWKLVVQHRLVLRVSSYSDTIISRIRSLAQKAIKNLPLPLYPPVSVPEYAPIPTDPLSDPTDP